MVSAVPQELFFIVFCCSELDRAAFRKGYEHTYSAFIPCQESCRKRGCDKVDTGNKNGYAYHSSHSDHCYSRIHKA